MTSLQEHDNGLTVVLVAFGRSLRSHGIRVGTGQLESYAIQCGFCTLGIVMSLYELLESNSTPEREEMIRALNGNLCRCTGYTKILESMESLQEKR
jgi:xanthine dehydrogenase iron-sulfur cluster and FAD-binding subunit A